jgi:hypothetical protein
MQSNILLFSPAYILAVDNTVFTRIQKTTPQKYTYGKGKYIYPNLR